MARKKKASRKRSGSKRKAAKRSSSRGSAKMGGVIWGLGGLAAGMLISRAMSSGSPEGAGA